MVTVAAPPTSVRARSASPLWWIALALALVGLRVLVLAAVLPEDSKARTGVPMLSGDPADYHELVAHAGLPYRGYPVAFPPVAWAFMEVSDGSSVSRTMANVAWTSLAFELLIALALAWAWRGKAAVVYLLLGIPFLSYPFVYFRIDLLSVALAVWAVALVKRDREVLGGTLLAVAVFAKLWPLALIPLLLVTGRRTAFRTCLAVGLGGALLWFGWSGVAGFRQVVTFKGATGWHIESLVGGIVQAIAHHPVTSQGGTARAGTAPFWATSALALLLVAACGWIWWSASRAREDDGLLYGVAPLGAVGAFLVFSPLLSPQYLCWLLPFAAISWIGGHRKLAGLVVASVVMTMMLTQTYHRLIAGDVGADYVLNLRNAMLVAIVVYAGMILRRARRTDGDRSGDVEHALECDPSPPAGAFVHDDLVDHVAADE